MTTTNGRVSRTRGPALVPEKAERAVLAGVLRDNARLDDAAWLAVEDFGVDAHRRLWRAVLALRQAGLPADLVTLAEALLRQGDLDDVGGPAALAALWEEAGAAAGGRVPYHVLVVAEAARRRRLGLIATRLATDAQAPAGPVAEAARLAAADLTALAADGPQPGGSRRTDGPLPEPIPASRLRPSGPGGAWLWHGYLARGETTLFSALWKLGKTTLLAHLVKALGREGDLCGRPVTPTKVLYVTEESEGRWAERVKALAIEDHAHFIMRPFKGRPDFGRWLALVDHLEALTRREGYGLVVLDVLTRLWPVQDENNNAAVEAALMPLLAVCEAGAALLGVHHNRKSGGEEATAPRGASALLGWVDTIIEARRYNALDRHDRRRVLTSYGRHDETPDEVVIELTEQGEYIAHGDRSDVALAVLLPRIADRLTADGLTSQAVHDGWPAEDGRPSLDRLRSALRQGAARLLWAEEGEGRRGSPYRYRRPSPDSSFLPDPYIGVTEERRNDAAPAEEAPPIPPSVFPPDAPTTNYRLIPPPQEEGLDA